jgi:hypothetical protein
MGFIHSLSHTHRHFTKNEHDMKCSRFDFTTPAPPARFAPTRICTSTLENVERDEQKQNGENAVSKHAPLPPKLPSLFYTHVRIASREALRQGKAMPR